MVMVLCRHGNGKFGCPLCREDKRAGRYILNDPSENEGRRMARAEAETIARFDVNRGRARLKKPNEVES